VVIPNVSAAQEGAASSSAPFDVGSTIVPSYAYQQVYMASAFSPDTRSITSIAFRPDTPAGGGFNETLGSITIRLSITSKTAQNLSSTFADNLGASSTVLASGPLTISSSYTSAAGSSRAFDIVIPLSTPFLYDPSQGNLIMEVRNASGNATSQFDFEFSTQIGRAYAFDANATGAAAVDPSRGLVTQFGVTLVPGPQTAAFMLGLVPLARRRRQHS
jgi:hypothetical protein